MRRRATPRATAARCSQTTDGGASWVALLAARTSATLRALAVIDAQTAYAAGDGGTVIKTTDGGAQLDDA